MIIKYFKDYIVSLNEGLIKTYPGDVVSTNLTNYLISLDILFNVEFLKDKNKIILTLNFFNSISTSNLDYLFDGINSIIVNRGGWFPTQMNIENVYGMKNTLKYNINNLYLNNKVYNNVQIVYEAKYDEKIETIPAKLYHLSIGEYKKKIIKYGLYPKSKDKLTSHLDRVYLCDNIGDCEYLITRMKLYYNEEKLFNIYNKQKRNYDKNTTPIIFEIDNSEQFIKSLYKDPNYENGYYTLDNIPPNKIKLVG